MHEYCPRRKFQHNSRVAGRKRTAGRSFPMPCLQKALFAFRRASPASARSRLKRRCSVIQGKKLALEAEQPKDHPVVLTLSVTRNKRFVSRRPPPLSFPLQPLLIHGSPSYSSPPETAYELESVMQSCMIHSKKKSNISRLQLHLVDKYSFRLLRRKFICVYFKKK